MGRYANSAVKYPVFSISTGALQAGDRPALALVGGGGSARSGIENSVTVFSVAVREDGLPSMKEETRFNTGARLATSIESSPDQRFMAASVSNGTLLMAYESSGPTIRELGYFETSDPMDESDTPLTQNVVRFSPTDGSLLATAGDCPTVTLWRLDAKQLQQEPQQEEAAEPADAKETDEEDKPTAGEEEVEETKPANDDSEAGAEEAEAAAAAEEEEEGERTDADADADADAETDAAEPQAKAEAEAEAAEETPVASRIVDLEGHTDEVRDVAFDPTGKLLATASKDRTCRLWNVATGKLLQMIPADAAANLTFRKCLFAGSDRLLTLQNRPGRDGVSFLVEFARLGAPGAVDEWQLRRAVQVVKGMATTLRLEAPYVVIGDNKGCVTLVDSESFKLVHCFKEVHGLPISGLSSMPDPAGGALVVTGSMDKTITMIPAKVPPRSVLLRLLLPVLLILLALALRGMLSAGNDDSSLREEL